MCIVQFTIFDDIGSFIIEESKTQHCVYYKPGLHSVANMVFCIDIFFKSPVTNFCKCISHQCVF